MPKTLLAVDDSATMRKVLEITFSGEDFRVVTAENAAAARQKMSEEPSVVILDSSEIGGDAYALAKELRGKDPKVTIVLLASRYNAYDANKGRDAGVDDYADKPFDTQGLIDKVKKAMLAREAGGGKAVAAAPAAASPAPTATTPSMQSPFAAKPAAAPTISAAKPAAASPQRTHTLTFEGTPPPVAVAAKPATPQPAAAAPAPAPTRAASRPEMTRTTVGVAPQAAPAAPAAAAAAQANIGGAVNGQLAGKLAELGLTPAQADAVLALSREVVERVVWEVVPQLAETIIKEEIARLTKEG